MEVKASGQPRLPTGSGALRDSTKGAGVLPWVHAPRLPDMGFGVHCPEGNEA